MRLLDHVVDSLHHPDILGDRVIVGQSFTFGLHGYSCVLLHDSFGVIAVMHNVLRLVGAQ